MALEIPPPTGPHAVGTTTWHWVDAHRPDVFAADAAARRELMVQCWYPALADPTAPRARYLPDADAVAPALAEFLGVPPATLAPLASVRSNAVELAPPADDGGPFAVVVMLVGIKGSYRQVQTFQAEELASHGYVVLALDQPGSVAMVVFPDGRRVAYDERWAPPHSAFMDAHIPYLARDVTFTLDRLADLARDDPRGILTGRLDLARVGLVAHSLGAIVGGEACRADARVRAAALEDARMPAEVVRDGLRQPVMFLTRPADSMRLERAVAGGWPESDIEETRSTMRHVYERLPGAGFFVEVRDMFHLDMTDAPMLAPLVPWPGLAGPIGAARVHRIVNEYTRAFLDRELRQRPAPPLEQHPSPFPEVTVESRG